MTTSGVASGRKMSCSTPARPRNRWRTVASAIPVPMTSAIAVASSPITIDFSKAGPSPCGLNGCSQWRSVKPCQVKLKRPWLSLNE